MWMQHNFHHATYRACHNLIVQQWLVYWITKEFPQILVALWHARRQRCTFIANIFIARTALLYLPSLSRSFVPLEQRASEGNYTNHLSPSLSHMERDGALPIQSVVISVVFSLFTPLPQAPKSTVRNS